MIECKVKLALSTALTNSDKRYHTHIGGSLLSDECTRRAAFLYRWAVPVEKHNEKTLRIFEMGKTIERIVLKWLEDTPGIELTEKSLSDAQEQVTSLSGHFKGHLDGIAEIDGKKYILEIKSHNDTSFKYMLKNGVEKSHPAHYLQCQSYMHFSGIKDCLYIAYNKNNSDIHIDHIVYNDSYGHDLEEKAQSLLLGRVSYPKVEMYKCKKFRQCPCFDICHNHGLTLHNCRTCIHLDPVDNGEWRCSKYDKIIPVDKQERGCDEHKQRAF